ncbi:MAG TPA: DMT family transporter [Jatrophihabitans sp.]|nr:DMT family transporter [Jatrophihabitans sp.]
MSIRRASTIRRPRPSDLTWLVALAAAMWGLDGLLRKPLALSLQPATVVLGEHAVAVLVLLPLVPAAVRVYLRCGWRDRVAVALIGIGASALGTALFTEAFRYSAASGDFITPLVLQKLQPIFAVLLAVLLLRERLRPIFAAFVIPALIGTWLLAFAQPLHVTVHAAQAALFAIGAALLWAAGTVLGRLVGDAIPPRELTTLRYLWGLPAAAVIVWRTGSPFLPGWSNVPGLVLLAMIPGLLALRLYYVGLRRTAAARATFAELAFPATAAVIGVLFLHARLTGSQWLGYAIVVGAITALAWHERGEKPAVTPPLLPEAVATPVG